MDGCGCGCSSPRGLVAPKRLGREGGSQFGGIFSTVLNVAGAFVGDPALGSQIAAEGSPGYAPITQDVQAIADTVGPDMLTALKAPADPKTITPQAGQIASAAAQAIAIKLAGQGYLFPPGTLGAQYQNPSVFGAFGGQNTKLVEYGFIGLLALLTLKAVRG